MTTNPQAKRLLLHGPGLSSRTRHPAARGALHAAGSEPSSSMIRTTVPSTQSSIPTSFPTDSSSPNKVNPMSSAPVYSKAVYTDLHPPRIELRSFRREKNENEALRVSNLGACHADERDILLSARIVHAAFKAETTKDPIVLQVCSFANPCDCLNRYEHDISVTIEPPSASQCHPRGLRAAFEIIFLTLEGAARSRSYVS